MSEASLQAAIMLRYGTDPRVKIWRSNTGAAVAGDRMIRFGRPGQADITGLICGSGRRLEIEVKSATGRQTHPQKTYQRMIEAAGGLYILARSVDDVESALAQEHP